MTVWMAALLSGMSVLGLLRPALRVPDPDLRQRSSTTDAGWVLRGRVLWSLLAGVGSATFVSGAGGLLAGAVVGTVAWVAIGRTEPVDVRRRRRAAERDLPGLVQLLAAALETGCDVADALSLVCEACPVPATELLAALPHRLSLGLPPDEAWRPVAEDPQLAPLARTLVRAARSGSSVTQEVASLASELADRSRDLVEERARGVGVKAAVPLGLCLLPAFVLIGVVPVAAGLLGSLDLA